MAASINLTPKPLPISLEDDMEDAFNFYSSMKEIDPETVVKDQLEARSKEIQKTMQIALEQLRTKRSISDSIITEMLNEVEADVVLDNFKKYAQDLRKQITAQQKDLNARVNHLATSNTYLQGISQNNSSLKTHLQDLEEALKRPLPPSYTESQLLNIGQQLTAKAGNINNKGPLCHR